MIYLNNKKLQQLIIDDIVIAKAYFNDQLVYKKINPIIAGDVALYDNKSEEIVIASEFINLDKSRYIPIGIVVIPDSHNVYNTGECGIMSLKSADYTNPNSGSTSNSLIYWGQYGTNISDLTNYSYVPILETKSGIVQSTISSTSNAGYLPVESSDETFSLICPHDPIAKYYNSSSSNKYISSCYTEDSSRNVNYYDTNESDINALSDFQGKNNTQILCNLSSQNNWKISSTITNSTSESTAAYCCWRYYTEGTQQGDWYLPSCGEFGYVCPRYDTINNQIQKLQEWFGEQYAILDVDDYFWTSTNYHDNSARYINMKTGYVSYNSKNRLHYVRPFLKGKYKKIN